MTPEGYVKITIDAGDSKETERITRLVHAALRAKHGWLVDQVGYTEDRAKSLWYRTEVTNKESTDD